MLPEFKVYYKCKNINGVSFGWHASNPTSPAITTASNVHWWYTHWPDRRSRQSPSPPVYYGRNRLHGGRPTTGLEERGEKLSADLARMSTPGRSERNKTVDLTFLSRTQGNDRTLLMHPLPRGTEVDQLVLARADIALPLCQKPGQIEVMTWLEHISQNNPAGYLL